MQTTLINDDDTRANVEIFLKSFPRLKRLANRATSIASPEISDMPRGEVFGNSRERVMAVYVDAKQEVEHILETLAQFTDPLDADILKAMYMLDKPLSRVDIQMEYGLGQTALYTHKNAALLEFADRYEPEDLNVYSRPANEAY